MNILNLMGNNCLCTEIENESTLIANNDNEEIEFPEYSSSSDAYLNCLEKDNNLFRYITLVEYINLLSYFNLDTANLPYDGPFRINFSYKEEFLSETFNEELFNCFLEKTILKNREIGEEESTFKEIFDELFSSLNLKLKQYYEDENKEVTKRDLICLGMLFCKTYNINKIKILFDIFKNQKDQFAKSEELNEFLISCFLISSYCLINAKKKISQINPIIPELTIEELKSLPDYEQMQDCLNLVIYFNKNFFNRNGFLRWEDFKQRFIGENNFGWIFSTKGIRQKMQENKFESINFINKVFNSEENEI